jgi:hypothetical protein
MSTISISAQHKSLSCIAEHILQHLWDYFCNSGQKEFINLTILQFSDPILCIIPTTMIADNFTDVKYSLIVSHCLHVFNYQHAKKLSYKIFTIIQ